MDPYTQKWTKMLIIGFFLDRYKHSDGVFVARLVASCWGEDEDGRTLTGMEGALAVACVSLVQGTVLRQQDD